MRRAARYLTAAALLGAGWFLVMLVPPWTRGWLLGDRRSIGWNAAMIVLTSVLVAFLFRGRVARASGLGGRLGNALMLPYVGCAIYLTLWNSVTWARSLLHGGLHNLYETVILYPWGLAFTMAACFVVVPYGYFCQLVMEKALDTED